MNDTTPERRRLMQKVRTKNTAPELAVRRALHGRGLRFRLHRADLPGRPDIVLPRSQVAVFVHGCFWHCCPECDRGQRRPRSNAAFWEAKLTANRNRDARQRQELTAAGWRVTTVWECAVRGGRLEVEVDRIEAMVREGAL